MSCPTKSLIKVAEHFNYDFEAKVKSLKGQHKIILPTIEQA